MWRLSGICFVHTSWSPVSHSIQLFRWSQTQTPLHGAHLYPFPNLDPHNFSLTNSWQNSVLTQVWEFELASEARLVSARDRTCPVFTSAFLPPLHWVTQPHLVQSQSPTFTITFSKSVLPSLLSKVLLLLPTAVSSLSFLGKPLYPALSVYENKNGVEFTGVWGREEWYAIGIWGI